jgi:hypothetical protein
MPCEMQLDSEISRNIKCDEISPPTIVAHAFTMLLRRALVEPAFDQSQASQVVRCSSRIGASFCTFATGLDESILLIRDVHLVSDLS